MEKIIDLLAIEAITDMDKIIDWYTIRLLGKQFNESVMQNGRLKIKRGYIFEGVKYYE